MRNIPAEDRMDSRFASCHGGRRPSSLRSRNPDALRGRDFGGAGPGGVRSGTEFPPQGHPVIRGGRRPPGGVQSGISTGFTLIEVALAVLIVAIGVLAVFSLLSSGMDSGARAIADTHAATFADSVFNAMRAKALDATERQTTSNNTWLAFWTAYVANQTSVTVSASSAWTQPGALAVRVGGPYTQIFENVASHRAVPQVIVDHVLRYSNAVTLTNRTTAVDVNAKVAVFSNINWTLTWTSTVAAAALYVWDGQFGATTATNALVFYTEFENPGNM